MAEGPEPQSENQSCSQSSVNDQSQPQVPASDGLKYRNVNIPIMYPGLVPGLFPSQLDQDQTNRGPGLYAVPVLPFAQPVNGFPTNYLIPLTYNIPTIASEPREVGHDQGEQPQQQQQEAGPQRQVVVRRHQTGALAPLIRWLLQRTQRAAEVGPRADNLPADDAQGAHPVGVNDGNMADENEHAREAEQGQVANRWWGIAKEIQLIATAFITSLLPGFNNLD